MKLTVTTLTGEKYEVEVSPGGTVKDVKRGLYKTGKVSSQMRLLQGQIVLQDDRKLSEYSITQDSAVMSALFEPDVDINIEVSTGQQPSQLVVPNSASVMALKVKVCDVMHTGVPPQKLDLLFGDLQLENDMPLHYHCVVNGSKLNILKPYVRVTITNNKGLSLHKRLQRNDTIKEVKDNLLKKSTADDGILYKVMDNEEYAELDDDMTVNDHKIKDGDRLYLISYTWLCTESIATVTGGKVEGIEEDDTLLSLKVRTQDQLGIPAKEVKVARKSNLKYYDENVSPIVSKFKDMFIGTEEDVRQEAAKRAEEKRKEQEERRKKLEERRRKETERKIDTLIVERARQHGMTVENSRAEFMQKVAVGGWSIETLLRRGHTF